MHMRDSLQRYGTHSRSFPAPHEFLPCSPDKSRVHDTRHARAMSAEDSEHGAIAPAGNGIT